MNQEVKKKDNFCNLCGTTNEKVFKVFTFQKWANIWKLEELCNRCVKRKKLWWGRSAVRKVKKGETLESVRNEKKS